MKRYYSNKRKKNTILSYLILIGLIGLLLFSLAPESIRYIIPIILMILALISLGVMCFRNGLKRRKYQSSRIREIDHMSGEEFEKCLEAHFHKLGYKTYLTSKSCDFGADLILKSSSDSIVIQAKRYKGKIGIAAIQEVFAAGAYYDCKHTYVVTNSFFTPQAKKLADKIGVELWDRNKLISKFRIDS